MQSDQCIYARALRARLLGRKTPSQRGVIFRTEVLAPPDTSAGTSASEESLRFDPDPPERHHRIRYHRIMRFKILTQSQGLVSIHKCALNL
jgi:hypothetical protein